MHEPSLVDTIKEDLVAGRIAIETYRGARRLGLRGRRLATDSGGSHPINRVGLRMVRRPLTQFND
jgi:hypothetical protein